MKVCPAFGPGFYYIPGSDTCLKVGGNVWFEYIGNQRFTAANDASGWRTQVKVNLDARTNTEYGLLRTVVSPRFNSRIGASTEASGSAAREGLAYDGTNTGGAQKQTQVNTVGYIQLGGLTVGRLGSFFGSSFYGASNVGYEGTDVRDEVDQVAYTVALGNGMTLTAAVEEGSRSNRDGVFSMANGAAYVAAVPAYVSATGVGVSATAATGVAVNYGGVQIPDLVAKFAVDQAWGKIELSGMAHSINYSTYQYTSASTEWGFGGQLAAKINLPMIGSGDYLFLNGIYASGINQLVWRNVTGDRNSQDTKGLGIGRVAVGMNDVVVDTTTGSTYQAKSYGFAGEFGHYFTPSVMAFVGGDYAKLDWAAAARGTAGTTNTSIDPLSWYRVNAGVVWSPIKDFKIVPEVTYMHVSVATATNAAASTEGSAKKNESAWAGRVRVTRDF